MKKIYVEMVADLFHYGHVEFLRKAKALGDYLVVGVLSDAWVTEHKKEPILTQEERARVIEGCRYVDEVILQQQPASAQWIKDNGFHRNAIAFRDESDKARHEQSCADYDITREVRLPYEHGISTTSIIERIQTRVLETGRMRKAFAPRWGGGDWLLARQMLQDTARIFSAHKILWFLTFGSLLGAVRHQGVIPWDDDIDIAVFQQDTQRLKLLSTTLNQEGYGFAEFSKNTPRGVSIVYKLWILDRPSSFNMPFSWPYIDIFVLRPSANSEQITIDNHPFPAAYFLPLKEARFGNLMLPVPAEEKLLELMYAPDYMTTCVSTHFIHRHEKPSAAIRCPASQVREAGCFIDMDTMADSVWAAAPLPVSGWALAKSSNGLRLVRNNTHLQVDDFTAQLWNSLNGKRTVGKLVGKLPGPRIKALHQVADAITLLERNHTIQLVPAKSTTAQPSTMTA